MALRIISSAWDAAGPSLAKCEWDMLTMTESVPEWQLLTMLNYEYARCCKPIVQAVKLLRRANRKPKGNESAPLPFARFLVKHYPEFPATPWAQIAESIRAERLGLFNVNAQTQFYPVDPPWQAWELFSADAENLREELTDESAKSFGVFNIDFSQDSTVIAELFHEWLEQRRKKFKPGKKNPEPSGRGHKKRKYEDSLKALGGLRALKYWGDSKLAEVMTDDNLCVGQRSWKRAEFQAGEMFARLTIAWHHRAIPFDPFDDFDAHCIFPPHRLKTPFPSLDRLRKESLAKYKERLVEVKKRMAEVAKIVTTDFVVSSLKIDVN